MKWRRVLWNILEIIFTGQYGGYQYTEEFNRSLLDQVAMSEREGEIISHFPLFPPLSMVEGPVSYYIDQTLTQLFSDYGFADKISPRVLEKAINAERQNYERAKFIVCMCRWAAQAVIEEYGIDPTKVHVIPGGANIDDKLIAEVPVSEHDFEFNPLRLGFIGKDIKRKNLSFLLEVAEELYASNQPVEVIAMGFDPAISPRHPLLKPLGYIDKHNAVHEFISTIRACYFGCLFSHAEAFGISNREFIRLGVPVLTWDVGGMADTVPTGLGHVFPANIKAGYVASVINEYLQNPERYLEWRKTVQDRSHEVSWKQAIEKFQAVWQGSMEYSYNALQDAG